MPKEYPALLLIPTTITLTSTFPYPEHLSTACGTHPLSCGLTILHGYALGILHFPFGAAFHTVRLHLSTSFLSMKDKPFPPILSIDGGARPL